MLTIGLFPNIEKTSVVSVLRPIIHYLQRQGVKVVLPDTAAQAMGYNELACTWKEITTQVAVGITLGGDGTLLHTARQLAPAGIPMCGINMGQLGFLTEIELPDLCPALNRIINKQYTVEERLMVETVVLRDGVPTKIASALNDIVVTKGGASRVVRLELYINDQLTAKYPADGLIISTATGSTGYSLSAGGPIVKPTLNVLVITPICPHTLDARPLIISENDEVKITVQAAHQDIVLTADGQIVYQLLPDDVVLVRRSPYRSKFLRLHGSRYYARLYSKLQRGAGHDC